MSIGGLVVLLTLSFGQADEGPLWEPVLEMPGGEEEAAPTLGNIRLIEHEDRRFRLAGAFGLRLEVGAAIRSEEYETDTAGAPRSRIDLEGDLGIPSVAPRLDGEIRFRPFPHIGLGVGGSFVEWEGSRRLDKEIRVGRVLFPVGSDLSSRFRLTEGRLHLDHDLGRWPHAWHGYRLGVRYTQTDLSVRASGGPDGRNRIGGAVPVLGYRGGYRPDDRIEIAAAITFFPVLSLRGGAEDEDLTLLASGDVRITVSYRPLDRVEIGAGYTFLEAFISKQRGSDEETVDVATHVIGIWGRVKF